MRQNKASWARCWNKTKPAEQKDETKQSQACGLLKGKPGEQVDDTKQSKLNKWMRQNETAEKNGWDKMKIANKWMRQNEDSEQVDETKWR